MSHHAIRAALVLAFAVASSSGLLAQQHVPRQTKVAADYRAAALSLEPLLQAQYAYPERLPGGTYRLTDKLREEAAAVSDEGSLLVFAERALLLLADHHAITGSSFADSWAIVPSYSDLWIERDGNGAFRIRDVRDNSPAALAGVAAGDRLVAINGVATDQAVGQFWHDLGADGGDERDSFAARILAAGRRDRPRVLTIQAPDRAAKTIKLPNLYSSPAPQPSPPVSLSIKDGVANIRIGNALGNNATIAAFDTAMSSIDADAPLVIDLTDTPSGGNTTVARAIMGWFARQPTPYQMHSSPAEERATGIARQWMEMVLPRKAGLHTGPLTVRVGRWTGSMGEGLALGLRELGAKVCGTPMAHLLGATEDFTLGESRVSIKIPTERLMAIDGTPRESYVPASCKSSR